MVTALTPGSQSPQRKIVARPAHEPSIIAALRVHLRILRDDGTVWSEDGWPGATHEVGLNQFVLVASCDDVTEIETMQLLNAAPTEHLLTVTDRTHGQAMMLLVGPASREVLSRLCSLDLHPSHFPNLSTQTSSVAKTRQIIIRQDVGDLPAFALIGASSLAAYLWETILVAGWDVGLQSVGRAAFIG